MDRIFSLQWFGLVGIETIAFVLIAWGLRKLASRRHRDFLLQLYPDRKMRRLLAYTAIALLGEVVISLGIRYISGPLSSQLWALFAAVALATVTEELALNSRTR